MYTCTLLYTAWQKRNTDIKFRTLRNKNTPHAATLTLHALNEPANAKNIKTFVRTPPPRNKQQQQQPQQQQ